MTTELAVGHGNGHNEQSLVAYARDTDWDSFGGAEVERLIAQLAKDPSVQELVHSNATFDRARDTAILVAKPHTVLWTSARKVSRALGRRGSDLNRVAPARVLVEARYTHPIADELGLVGVCHLNLHPVAGPRQLNGRNPLAPLTRQYRKAWRAARRSWRTAQRDGFLCVLTSDAQMTAASTRAWAPGKQARRMNARAWSTGIDWVLFDHRLALVGVPKKRRLHDHDGFIATFDKRSK